MDVIQTLHGIVVNCVPKHFIDFERDKPEDIITLIQEFNHNEIMVKKAVPLRKRTRNADVPTQSIIIFKRFEEADKCTERGIKIVHRHYTPVSRDGIRSILDRESTEIGSDIVDLGQLRSPFVI